MVDNIAEMRGIAGSVEIKTAAGTVKADTINLSLPELCAEGSILNENGDKAEIHDVYLIMNGSSSLMVL